MYMELALSSQRLTHGKVYFIPLDEVLNWFRNLPVNLISELLHQFNFLLGDMKVECS